MGGPLCCDAKHFEPGPRDQRAVENRDDVLVYSTPPLAHDLEVTGPVTMTCSSDPPPSIRTSPGSWWTWGPMVSRKSYGRHFADALPGFAGARSLMNPGQIYEIIVDLWATSNVFLKGHSLRLEISSSNFPRFDRNLNTGEPIKYARTSSPPRMRFSTMRSIRRRWCCRSSRQNSCGAPEATSVTI